MGLASRLAFQRARQEGLALRPLLRKARLTAEQLEDPKARLAVRDQIDFLNIVAEALDDDMLGHHLALDFDLRLAGLFHYVLASSDTLLELFERGARYTSLVNEGVQQTAVDDRRIGLAIRYAGIRRQTDRHQIEFWITALLRTCRECTGVHVKPLRVRLTHYRGRSHAALSRFLGCSVEFGASIDEVLFARDAGELRIGNADPYLGRVLVGVCEDLLARRPRAADSFVARVENSIAPLLPHGDARATEIATRLGQSQRTFARRLAEEGLTFSDLLHRLRLDQARRFFVVLRLPVWLVE